MLFIYFLSKLFFGFFFLAGRNVYGRITIFHRGGGLRRRLRLVDYLRNIGSFGVLVDIFKCRYNTAYLGLVCYFSGFFSLVVVCCGMFVGSRVYSGYFVDPAMRFNPFVCGSSVPLRFVSLGHIVCLVELIIGGGAQVLRAAGLWGKVVSQQGYSRCVVRLSSGVLLRVSGSCLVTLGRVSNVGHRLFCFSKAGDVRKLGFRPIVRGEAMNPVDHPHGGRTRGGRIPVTPWGRVTKGKKTVCA